MAKSTIGLALGFINTITTRVMAGVKGREEEILALPEETIKTLADEFVQKLVLAVESATKILKFVCSVTVPAVSKFIAADAFGEKNEAGIKFWLNDAFKENFLGKIEKDIPEATLAIQTLKEDALDKAIRAELTPEFEETMLAQLYELLKKQPKGEAGDLLVNGYANIFYVRDIHGNLWAVIADWDASSREWSVCACSVTDPFGWYAGCQVVSRKLA